MTQMTLMTLNLGYGIPESTELFTAKATNSDTMQAVFTAQGGINIQFNLTAYGMAGQFATTAGGQWGIVDDTLQLAINGQNVELTETADGSEFAYDGNTYAVTTDELAQLRG